MEKLTNKWYNKEDYWAIIVGLGLLIIFSITYITGNIALVKNLSVGFSEWYGLNIIDAFLGNGSRINNIISLYAVFAVLFSIAGYFLGYKIKRFFVGFTILYILSIIVNILSVNMFFKNLQFEAAFIALLIGLILGNSVKLPTYLHSALRTEFYVKTGVIFMGATLPLNVILTAGPVAILQATIVAVVTFFSIYFAATKLFKLDPRFSATLGAGGSICGVSAAIAIGSSCRAKQQYVSIAITLVILWAVVMIFVLPILGKILQMGPGAIGAWIGTSEFADAAGFAAAAGVGDESAIKAFTLMKVIGRDIFVGIWAILAAVLSVTIWEKTSLKDAERISIKEIWHRFPKFVLGFVLASIIVSLIILNLQDASSEYNKDVLSIIKNLRGWAFTWTFLSIGLTTRIRELSDVGWKPLAAFTIGVLINVPLGYILSNIIFVDFWNAL